MELCSPPSHYLEPAQVDQLLRPINPKRVNVRDGQSHLEAYDVRAQLNRIFDFARWSADTVAMELLYETLETIERNNQQKAVVSVGYRAQLRLTVCAPDGTQLATYTEWAAGDATNFPVTKRADAHDFAIKTAESQALKRCATNLGDQFGLSLYNKGSRDALVGTTVRRHASGKQPSAIDAHVTEVAPENGPQTGEGYAMFLRDEALKASGSQRVKTLRGLLVQAQAGRVTDWMVPDANGELVPLQELLERLAKAAA